MGENQAYVAPSVQRTHSSYTNQCMSLRRLNRAQNNSWRFTRIPSYQFMGWENFTNFGTAALDAAQPNCANPRKDLRRDQKTSQVLKLLDWAGHHCRCRTHASMLMCEALYFLGKAQISYQAGCLSRMKCSSMSACAMPGCCCNACTTGCLNMFTSPDRSNL